MGIYLTAAVIGLSLLTGVPGRTVAAAAPPQARIVHFPADRSLGKLWLRDADAAERDDTRFVESDAQEYLCPARPHVAWQLRAYRPEGGAGSCLVRRLSQAPVASYRKDKVVG